MTKTCLQCGAVLPSSVRACDFCNSSFHPEHTQLKSCAETWALGRPISTDIEAAAAPDADTATGVMCAGEQATDWRGELAQRVEAYRVRKSRPRKSMGQAQLLFEELRTRADARPGAEVAEHPRASDEAFSFTFAIGPQTSSPEKHGGRMEIDVSVPNRVQQEQPGSPSQLSERYGLYPVASLEERRIAALIDAVCLLFAYGGFMALFGSLGGQFTFSKLSAAVCGVTIAIVYLQYFALFTVFGATTPGMMLRGLQVISFTGDPPTPRQMLLRSVGYVLSAGTLFLGFLWAWWDEDALTWHDRLSRTYLSTQQADTEFKSSAVAHGR